MILSLLALTAAAEEPAFFQPVAFQKTSDPSLLTFVDGRQVQIDYGSVSWETVDAWPAGTPLQYAYTEADGPVIIEPTSGTRLAVVGVMQGTEHIIDIMEDACQEKAYSTVDMVTCSAAATSAWEAWIARGYAHLLAHGSAEQRAAAEAAEQQWQVYRDAWLAMNSAYYATMDGTIVRIYAAGARRGLIRGHALQVWDLAAEVR